MHVFADPITYGSFKTFNVVRSIKHDYLSQHVIIGRAKRAPHWGVQSRFRVIYIYIYIYMLSVCCMSVVCQINCVGGITYGPRACSKSFFLAVKTVTPVLFNSYTLEL